MEAENSEFEILIVKKIKSSLSSKEELRLQFLIQNDPEFQRQYQEMMQVWQASEHLNVREGLSFDARWEQLHSKIEDKSAKQVSFKKILRYAAIIALLALAYIAYDYSNKDQSKVISTKYGETKEVLLPDQSRVSLNADSYITYVEKDFSENRTITTEGEVFFEVQKNAKPFTVKSSQTIIKVLGTKFNVRTRNNETIVSCISGKVSVSKKENARHPTILAKGFSLKVGAEGDMTPYLSQNAEITSWITGDLAFKNTPLTEVFAEIERRFNVRITYNKTEKSESFSGTMIKPDLKGAIQTVCLSAGLDYKINSDSTIVISEKKSINN